MLRDQALLCVGMVSQFQLVLQFGSDPARMLDGVMRPVGGVVRVD